MSPRETYGGADAEWCLAHLCTRFMRWNCVHVAWRICFGCQTSTHFEKDIEDESPFQGWGDGAARCRRNSGNGRGSLWLYFVDALLPVVISYIIIPYPQPSVVGSPSLWLPRCWKLWRGSKIARLRGHDFVSLMLFVWGDAWLACRFTCASLGASWRWQSSPKPAAPLAELPRSRNCSRTVIFLIALPGFPGQKS